MDLTEHRDSRGRFTHSAVEAATGMKIPIEMLAELRMTAAAMSRAVKKITDVANLDASGAKAVLTHGFMREAAGESPTLESLAQEAADVFGPAIKYDARKARAARAAGAGALIGLAGPPSTYAQGAGFDFGSFLRNAGKAAKVAAAVAPTAAAAAHSLGFDNAARAAQEVGLRARMASQTARKAAQAVGAGIVGQDYGAGLDIGGLDIGGLDIGGRAYDQGALIASDLQHASLGRGSGLILGGTGGLILGGARARAQKKTRGKMML